MTRPAASAFRWLSLAAVLLAVAWVAFHLR